MAMWVLYDSLDPGAPHIDMFEAETPEDVLAHCSRTLNADLFLGGDLLTDYYFREVGKIEPIYGLFRKVDTP